MYIYVYEICTAVTPYCTIFLSETIKLYTTTTNEYIIYNKYVQ